MRVDKMVKATVDALEDIKGHDIVVLNNVQEKLKALGAAVYGVEGADSGEWILVDLGAVVVHIMQPAIRQYYNLEELWGKAAVSPRRRAVGAARS